MNRWIPLLALTGCIADTPQPPEGPQVESYVTRLEIPSTVNTEIDILFVVDSSPAMAAVQTKLAADYVAMVDGLSHLSFGSLPDVHIGFTTTDRADGGVLRREKFIADAPRFAWRRERNYLGPLVDAFVDLAEVGTAGSSDLQPLDAMQRALDPDVNPDFVRDDAFLAVVFLTTGDDHGTTAPADVARALKQLKDDPGKVVVAGAYGACTRDQITATDAPRLAALFDQFPNRSSHTTICDETVPNLVNFGSGLIRDSFGLACLSHVREPRQCNVWIEDPHTAEQLILPECFSPEAGRCWSLKPEPFNCFDGGLAFQLHPYAFPFSAITTVECVAE